MNTTAKQMVGPALSAVIVAGTLIGGSSIAMTVAAPAQADACTQFGFPNGANGFDTGWGASLQFNAAGKSVPQVASGWLGGKKGSGYLNGNVNGTGLSFTWKGDAGPPSNGENITFSGTVDLDGSAHGTAVSGDKITTFTSQKRLVCLDAPVVAPPPPAPAPVPAPAPAPAPTGATLNGNVDLYDVPGGNGTVTGQLKKGDAVTVIGTCPMNNPNNSQDPNNGWCKITDTTQHKTGAVWGDFVSQ